MKKLWVLSAVVLSSTLLSGGCKADDANVQSGAGPENYDSMSFLCAVDPQWGLILREMLLDHGIDNGVDGLSVGNYIRVYPADRDDARRLIVEHSEKRGYWIECD